jgi:hypothetical protein
VNTCGIMLTLISKELAYQRLFNDTIFTNSRRGGRKLKIFGCAIFVFAELNKLTAPLIKFETLARQNASFSRSYIRLLVSHPPPMRPRTILGAINRNRGVRNELTPNQRGKIQDTRLAGATFKVAAEIAEYAPSTAKTTIRRAPERHNR